MFRGESIALATGTASLDICSFCKHAWPMCFSCSYEGRMLYAHTFIDSVEPCARWYARCPSDDVARLWAAADRAAIDAACCAPGASSAIGAACRTPGASPAARGPGGTNAHHTTAADPPAR